MPELNLPTPGVTGGPEWASQLNSAITEINDEIETGRLSEAELSATMGEQASTPGTPLETALSTKIGEDVLGSDYVAKIQVVTDPEKFTGLDITGATEDAAAVQAVIDATPVGGTCRIVGKHKIGTALTNRGRSITLDMTDAELIRDGSSGHIIDFYGATPTIHAVSSVASGTTVLLDGTRSSVTITLGSAAPAWVRGQIVKLIADDVSTGVRPGPGDGTEQRSGEFLVVQSVSGSTVTCLGVLLEAYTTNARLLAMPETNVELIGGTLTVPDAGIVAGWGSATVRLRHLVKPRIESLRIKASGGAGIFIDGCFAYEIDHYTVDFAINNPSGNQFGYGIADCASAHGKISNVHTSHVRHVFTDVAPWVAADSSSVWKYGRTRATQLVNCSGFATTNTAFDTHSWSQGISFVGCIAQSCFAGYALRGKEHRISDCHVSDANRGLVIFTESSGGDSYGHRIDGLTMDRVGIPFYVDINPAGHPSADVRETRPSYIDNVHVRDGGVMSLISNATLFLRRVYIEVAAAMVNSSRLMTLTNTELVGQQVEFDYRKNMSGNNLAIFRVEAGSTLELDKARYYGNPAGYMRLDNLIDGAPTAIIKITDLIASHGANTSVVTTTAAGGWSDWETLNDGRNSGYIEGSDSGIEASTSNIYAWLGRTRKNALVRLLPTANRTMLALPDGKVRGQLVRIANWATSGGWTVTVPHGAATYNIITKSGAPVVLNSLDSITLAWNGSDWYQV